MPLPKPCKRCGKKFQPFSRVNILCTPCLNIARARKRGFFKRLSHYPSLLKLKEPKPVKVRKNELERLLHKEESDFVKVINKELARIRQMKFSDNRVMERKAYLEMKLNAIRQLKPKSI